MTKTHAKWNRFSGKKNSVGVLSVDHRVAVMVVSLHAPVHYVCGVPSLSAGACTQDQRLVARMDVPQTIVCVTINHGSGVYVGMRYLDYVSCYSR